MLDLLRQHRVDVVICMRSTTGPASWAPGELRRFAEELDLAAEELSQPRNAVMRASALARGRGWILVTGSFRIVGEIRSIILELGAQQRPILAHSRPAPDRESEESTYVRQYRGDGGRPDAVAQKPDPPS